MTDQHYQSIWVNILCGIMLLSLLGCLYFLWQASKKTFTWYVESITFDSGISCFVCMEPKLVFFSGPINTPNAFDRIRSHQSIHNITLGSSMSGFMDKFKFHTVNKRIILEKQPDGSQITISKRGTSITLPDGQKFALNGKTPVFIYCDENGRFVKLDKLPIGFGEYFERSTPPGSDLKDHVKSYPAAFRDDK
jgi:hypothetical protein